MKRYVQCPECTRRRNGEPVRFEDKESRMQKCPWCLALLVIVVNENTLGEVAIIADRKAP